jgi:peptidoglycan-associated lipoprotein
MKEFLKLLMVLFLSIGLFACGGSDEEEDLEDEDPELVDEEIIEELDEDGSPIEDDEFEDDEFAEDDEFKEDPEIVAQPTGSFPQQMVIYFDYDRSSIRGQYTGVISSHAQYLASNPSVAVKLEGHADERGSREYNIALGERRANSVRSQLMFNGVNQNQIRVVSFGEELPISLGHNESSWSQNRRVEFVYNK